MAINPHLKKSKLWKFQIVVFYSSVMFLHKASSSLHSCPWIQCSVILRKPSSSFHCGPYMHRDVNWEVSFHVKSPVYHWKFMSIKPSSATWCLAALGEFVLMATDSFDIGEQPVVKSCLDFVWWMNSLHSHHAGSGRLGGYHWVIGDTVAVISAFTQTDVSQ
jgi:hypothetical protein